MSVNLSFFLGADGKPLNSLELTRRVTPLQWEGMRESFSNAFVSFHDDYLVEWYVQFKANLESCSYLSKIGEDRYFPYRILYAVHFPKSHPYHISVKTFATLMLFWQVMQENPGKVEIVDLKNENGCDLIKAPLKDLNANNLEGVDFSRIVGQKKLLKRSVALIQDYGESSGIIKAIKDAESTFLFFAEKEKNRFKMTPSIFVVDQLLEEIFKGDAILSNPVLGDSTVKDLLRSQKKVRRDLQIFFPGIEVPEVADTYKVVAPTDFSLHDIYHLYIGSYCSKEHKKILIALAEYFTENNIFLKIRNILIDGEFVTHRNLANEEVKDSDAIFWIYIAELIKEGELKGEELAEFVAIVLLTVNGLIKNPSLGQMNIILLSSEPKITELFIPFWGLFCEVEKLNKKNLVNQGTH